VSNPFSAAEYLRSLELSTISLTVLTWFPRKAAAELPEPIRDSTLRQY